ncbi:hypothetical protein PR002_g9145 [Phytophthora rubi]|uniref:Uncharacterized protein n=2 Tax=Phytophthora rubi TaxID=129364 RepID=A0A6A3MM34_9STRA|nr:hypothetical protein PR002_g9145 [Phytophthora rubi]
MSLKSYMFIGPVGAGAGSRQGCVEHVRFSQQVASLQQAMPDMLQPPKDLYLTLRETLFVRFVLTILTPFVFVVGMLLRSHYRKVNGQCTPGLTRYRPGDARAG